MYKWILNSLTWWNTEFKDFKAIVVGKYETLLTEIIIEWNVCDQSMCAWFMWDQIYDLLFYYL